jgi:hypothetical protein
MRVAIRRVRALVRRNGPMFSSSSSISGRQRPQAAAGGPCAWRADKRGAVEAQARGIERAPATVTGGRVRDGGGGERRVNA